MIRWLSCALHGRPAPYILCSPCYRPVCFTAVLVVQHIAARLHTLPAERLDSLSALKVKEAAPGDRLQLGLCLLAPGGFHMQVDRSGQVGLNQNPAVHGVRPAVDVTMTCIAQNSAPTG
jgi:two-component system chemotaxis response regulator CheB